MKSILKFLRLYAQSQNSRMPGHHIRCSECGDRYYITAFESRFYASRGKEISGRCRLCQKGIRDLVKNSARRVEPIDYAAAGK